MPRRINWSAWPRWMGERRRYWFAAIVGLLGLAAITYATLVTLKQQRYDGLRINLAGRQRMLSQKLSKEALLLDSGKTSPAQLRRTMRAFGETLTALTHGGRAPLDLTFRRYAYLPPSGDPPTERQLGRVVDLWTPFAAHLEAYLEHRRPGDLAYVVEHNPALLAAMDRSVGMMQDSSERHSLFVAGVLGAAVLLLIAFLTALLWRQLLRARQASEHIEQLEHLLPICANCKNIREAPAEGAAEDAGDPNWVPIEAYLNENEDLSFTHSLCPSCTNELYPDFQPRKEAEETPHSRQASPSEAEASR